MVEYNKQCLRYRFFLLFKLVEKLLPSLFNKIYLFDLMNVKLKKSKLLIENLNSISQIKFFEQDIFNIDKKYFHFFDVVRVSNLLNYSYFSENQIKVAINNLKKISKENSIILINRTPNNSKNNTASFFRKKKGKFELIEDLNGGYEIKNLILN